MNIFTLIMSVVYLVDAANFGFVNYISAISVFVINTKHVYNLLLHFFGSQIKNKPLVILCRKFKFLKKLLFYTKLNLLFKIKKEDFSYFITIKNNLTLIRIFGIS